MKIYYDLHIHSALSPCSSDDMTPNNIVNMALLKELDIISVTDHNSAGNLEATKNIASNKSILLIPGIEVESREGVHVLCYFKDFCTAKIFGDEIYRSLPNIKCSEIFGNQNIFNQNDEIIDKLDKLLISSSKYTVYEIYNKVNEVGGAMIFAHIFRKSNGILSVLGFLPDKMNIKTLEINSKLVDYENYKENYKIIHNSDAHELVAISEKTNYIELKKLNVESVIEYLRG